MSKFLRLAHDLINTRYITMICMYKGEYHIKIAKSVENSIQGGAIMGSGLFTRDNTTIIIKEKEHADNYKIVSEWIQKNEDL
uniref:Uncharacterized protein n=1 Tax=viral metagenome TaxID=1070528 RepID=A0A6C0I7A3_9ZZZZ